MSKRMATFDLDSTLADTEHRHNLIDRSKPMDWLAYSKACVDDTLVEAIGRVVEMCHELGVLVVYVTGRMEGAREETIEWLRGTSLEGDSSYEDVSSRLFMDDTKSGDHVTEFGSHAAYKVDRIKGVIDSFEADHLFHVDDYAEVALELNLAGIPCIPVRPPFEVRASASQKQELA